MLRAPNNLSLQVRVLSFGFLQDGDVGAGVFPEREEIFVGGERPNAGSMLRSNRNPSEQEGSAYTI